MVLAPDVGVRFYQVRLDLSYLAVVFLSGLMLLSTCLLDPDSQ